MTTLGQPQFSDAAIRQFLLGQLRGNDQAAFERALFCDSSLERRTQLEEIALADDYATRTLRGKDLNAFIERFPFSAPRQSQIEVSMALDERFAPEAQRAAELPTFKHPVWKLAFATMILIMLFATIWIATKEPRIVRRFLPHRIRPAAANTPTPEVAHHAERASEPAAHREDSPSPPSHEAATNTIVLVSATTEENAPIVTLAAVHDQNVRVQLMINEVTQSSYVAELMKNTGEVVFSKAEITTTAEADRINFDIPIEYLAAGDFQIKLTRTSDGNQVTYFLRVK